MAGVRTLRGLGMLGTLALAQLRHHKGRWALLAAGIALVVAVPIISDGLAVEVRAQSITRAVQQLDPGDRALLVTLEGDAPGATGARADTTIRTQLGRLTGYRVRREMQYRRLTAKGQQFVLGATDDLGAAVRLTSGRLPRTCTPRRCEVVVVGHGDYAALDASAATLGVAVVGTADQVDRTLFRGQLSPGSNPLLLGGNVAAMARLDSLSLFSRFIAWTAPIDAARVVATGVPGYLRLGIAVETALATSVSQAVFIRPDQPLIDANNRADVSTRRFGLLGGLAAALLLGFAVVAASGLRRETGLLVSVLRRRGAVPAQIGVVVTAQSVAAALVGAFVGTAVGAAVVGLVVTGTAGESAAHTVSSAVQDATPAAAGLCAAAAVVVTAVLLWPETRSRALWRLLDLVALFSLGAAILAAERGHSDLASGSDPLVVALPVLAAAVAGLVAARLWAPLATVVARLLPTRSVAGRIGLLGMIRRPLRPAATVAFLTAAIASVVFAGAYRATLLVGAADQAAYQVPLDATMVTTGDGPIPPAVLDRYGAPADTRVYPVLRVSGAVTRLAGVIDAVPVVGVDAAALPEVHRWSRTTGATESPETLAAALRTPAAPSGPRLPRGTQTLAFATTHTDPRTIVSIWLATPSGREIGVALRPGGPGLVGPVRAGGGPAPPLHIVAISVNIAPNYLDRQQHAVGEGNTDQPVVSGSLHLGALSADGAPVATNWASWGTALGAISATASGITLQYRLAGQAMVAVPSYAAAAVELPVATDPTTAESAHDGLLTLTLDGAVQVQARVVAVVPRLPTTGSSFILADRTSLTRTLNRGEPGRNATEAWLSGPTTALSKPPWTQLQTTDRASVQADLDSDPIGRGARTLLILVALLALAVGAVALVLLVIGERRDGAGELYAWEADGIRPRVLRRMLLVRMGIIAITAVPVGAAAGLILAHVGTDLVAVDASGTTPTPPLRVTLGSVWTPTALVIGIGAGLLLGALVALRTLRERFPVPAEADLR